MCEAGTPVFFEAIAFAFSQISRGIRQASTTHRMISVLPSLRARLRACIGSVTVLAKAPFMLPLIGAGNFVGVMSWANAPARKVGVWAAQAVVARQRTATRGLSRLMMR